MPFIKYYLLILCLLPQLTWATDIWQINGMNIYHSDNVLHVKVNKIESSIFKENITNINYQCKTSNQIYPLHHCDDGHLNFSYEGNSFDFNMAGWFDFSNNSWDFKLSNDNNSLQIHYASKLINKIEIEIKQMLVSELSLLLKPFIQFDFNSTSAIISTQLVIDFENDMRVDGSYTLDEFNWESELGEYVMAENHVNGQFLVRQNALGINLNLKTNIETGEGLFEDIYVLFDENPLFVSSNILLDNDFNLTKLNFKINSTEAIKLDVDVIDFNTNHFDIKFDIKNMSRFYQGFLSSYFEIIGINDAEIEGLSKGKLGIVDGDLKYIDVDIKETYLLLDSKKIEVDNLFANIHWKETGELQESNFKWDTLLLAGMPINQSQLHIQSAGQKLKIKNGTIIPIFDGSVIIHQLELNDIFKPQISIDFDGEVKPVSLALITEKMGWPIMSGNISGKIPGMKKVGNSITFDGSLELNIFDGSMKVDDLSMERLFGIAPVIAADIEFHGLDIHQITNTYDFGDITGVLNGYVNNLRITNWKTDRLEAYFETEKIKGLKQTISQRAIENISSIGGIQGALSRSFLRYFEYFKYKRIGIGCKLRNSICEMRGLTNSQDKYHLIEGKGLPSINIFGFRKFIDWEIFLDRLLNANF